MSRPVPRYAAAITIIAVDDTIRQLETLRGPVQIGKTTAAYVTRSRCPVKLPIAIPDLHV